MRPRGKTQMVAGVFATDVKNIWMIKNIWIPICSANAHVNIDIFVQFHTAKLYLACGLTIAKLIWGLRAQHFFDGTINQLKIIGQ